MSILYVGISGVARAGKDTFAAALEGIIKEEAKYSVQRLALAQPLKADCANFIREKLGMDVFTNDTEEKAIFRELLVWYGKVKRQQTEGTYWTSLLQKKAEENPTDIVIVSDIRYQQYEWDETAWLQKKMRGLLIHVERTDINGDIIPPANMDESINDGIVKALSDYQVEWPTYPMGEFIPTDIILGVNEIYQTVIKPKIHAEIN